jgi:hypothetical protein
VGGDDLQRLLLAKQLYGHFTVPSAKHTWCNVVTGGVVFDLLGGSYQMVPRAGSICNHRAVTDSED